MQRHLPLLSRYLDLPSLSPFLIARNLTTFEECLKLEKQWQEGHRQFTVVELLAVLQRKSPEWEDCLLEVLRESVQDPSSSVPLGHKYILDEIGKQPILRCHCGNGLRSVSTTANLQQQVGSHNMHYPNHKYHSDYTYCSRLLEKIDELVRENATLKQQNRVLESAQWVPIGVKEPVHVPEPSPSMANHSAIENETYTQQHAGDDSFCTETKSLADIAEEVVERAIRAATQKQFKASSLKSAMP